MLRRLSLAFVLLLLAAAARAAEPTRRALLIGINCYADPCPSTEGREPVPPLPAVPRLPVPGERQHRPFTNLDGPVNDIKDLQALLVSSRFGFRPEHVHLLLNRQATAANILGSIRKHLIDDAAPGDTVLLVYAGHGSQVRNRANPPQAPLDQTLVPADAPQGTPDIRDKELGRLFRAARRKGVTFTFIADSCHSGSLARGESNRGPRARANMPDSREVDDPGEKGPDGQLLPPPDQDGSVVVLSAAQDYQAAWEKAGGTGTDVRGIFSDSLRTILANLAPDERLDRLFDRVRARVRSERNDQDPVLAGYAHPSRRGKGLLGQPARTENATLVSVRQVEPGHVVLQGGTALGLYPGSELVEMVGQAGAPALRVQITPDGLGPGQCQARPVSDQGEALPGVDLTQRLQAGATFRLDKWAVPDEPLLTVYIPPQAAPPAAVAALAAVLRTLPEQRPGLTLVADPTAAPPTHVLFRGADGWLLERRPVEGPPVPLGPAPTLAALLAALPGRSAVRLFWDVPPPPGLRPEVKLGAGSRNDALDVTSQPAAAQYRLVGRWQDGAAAYAWMQTDADQPPPAGRAPTPLPRRTDWVPVTADGAAPAGAELTRLALLLGRVRGWQRLLPREPGTGQSFPYRLVLQRISDSADAREGQPLRHGERYRLLLRADPATLADGVTAHWVYVFAIDQHGRSTLLFPQPGQGDVGNRIPRRADGDTAVAEVRLSGFEYDFEISPPYGTDTYYLLATQQPLGIPETLESAGVVSRGAASPLQALLVNFGVGTRAATRATPANWRLERVVLESVASAAGGGR